jgi:branched-chain amino acid transport system ATP-binding protein
LRSNRPASPIGREETERQVELLLRLKGEVTMILVEHDMAAVFALADRISVLIRGRVLITDLPEVVRADPQVVTAYLGEQME